MSAREKTPLMQRPPESDDSDSDIDDVISSPSARDVEHQPADEPLTTAMAIAHLLKNTTAVVLGAVLSLCAIAMLARKCNLTTLGSSSSSTPHEFLGGIPGGRFSAAKNATEKWSSKLIQPPPKNKLVLLGVLSGSANFAERDWVRRAFWAQRPWEYGVSWQFVVGKTLPRGDNNRISMLYEGAKFGDILQIDGDEIPPFQATKALSWLVKQSKEQDYSFYILTSERHMLNLRRLGDTLGGRRPNGKAMYAGHFGWASWPANVGKHARNCALGMFHATERRLVAAAANSLSFRSCGGPDAPVFLSAGLELQVFSAYLLNLLGPHISSLLTTGLKKAQLQISAPLKFDGKEIEPKSFTSVLRLQAEELGALAVGRLVSLVDNVTYARMPAPMEFVWDPKSLVGAMALLNVPNAVGAEAVVAGFEKVSQPSVLSCPTGKCGEWGSKSVVNFGKGNECCVFG